MRPDGPVLGEVRPRAGTLPAGESSRAVKGQARLMDDFVEQLFVRTVHDLEIRLGSSDWYEVLGAAPLMRKLLWDRHPLVHRANRRRQVQLRFAVAVRPSRPQSSVQPLMSFVGDGIDPEARVPGASIETVSVDGLGRVVVGTVRGAELTVRDVVTFEANVGGGVHLGSPKKLGHRVAAELGDSMFVDEVPATLHQLRVIGRIVVRGLDPLRQAILASPSPGTSSADS